MVALVEGLVDELLRREAERHRQPIPPLMVLVNEHGSPLNVKGASPMLDPQGNLFSAAEPWPSIAARVRAAARSGRPIDYRCVIRDERGTPRSLRVEIAPMSSVTAMVIVREETAPVEAADHPLINMAARALARLTS
jgi:hypothetical protein